jgi:hypothetical protein
MSFISDLEISRAMPWRTRYRAPSEAGAGLERHLADLLAGVVLLVPARAHAYREMLFLLDQPVDPFVIEDFDVIAQVLEVRHDPLDRHLLATPEVGAEEGAVLEVFDEQLREPADVRIGAPHPHHRELEDADHEGRRHVVVGPAEVEVTTRPVGQPGRQRLSSAGSTAAAIRSTWRA